MIYGVVNVICLLLGMAAVVVVRRIARWRHGFDGDVGSLFALAAFVFCARIWDVPFVLFLWFQPLPAAEVESYFSLFAMALLLYSSAKLLVLRAKAWSKRSQEPSHDAR